MEYIKYKLMQYLNSQTTANWRPQNTVISPGVKYFHVDVSGLQSGGVYVKNNSSSECDVWCAVSEYDIHNYPTSGLSSTQTTNINKAVWNRVKPNEQLIIGTGKLQISASATKAYVYMTAYPAKISVGTEVSNDVWTDHKTSSIGDMDKPKLYLTVGTSDGNPTAVIGTGNIASVVHGDVISNWTNSLRYTVPSFEGSCFTNVNERFEGNYYYYRTFANCKQLTSQNINVQGNIYFDQTFRNAGLTSAYISFNTNTRASASAHNMAGATFLEYALGCSTLKNININIGSCVNSTKIVFGRPNNAPPTGAIHGSPIEGLTTGTVTVSVGTEDMSRLTTYGFGIYIPSTYKGKVVLPGWTQANANSLKNYWANGGSSAGCTFTVGSA